jgi:hypothetical protein
MPRVARRLVLIVTILSAACAEPPNKEINQAQGAIDAARAAGAEKFATAEYTAAVDALKRSEEAVTAGDYRQALSHAIDSRDRAQNAAKMAVEGRVEARGQAERAVAEVATLLNRAQDELKAAGGRTLQKPRDTIAAADKSLQEARTALKTENYAGVAAALDGVAATVRAALNEIDAAGSSRPPARRR